MAIRFADLPLWRLIVTRLNGEVLTTLDRRASERSFAFALNQPATATGLVPSDDPEINIPTSAAGRALLSHNTRLLYGLRREERGGSSDAPYVCRYGGIVMGLEDVAADSPTSRYTAYDPWQYLFSRPIRDNTGALPTSDGIIYTDERASVMATDLLANTIAVDGDVLIDASDAGLIEATDVIDGSVRFERGLSVGEAWQRLCDTGTIDIWLRPIYDPLARPGILCELVIAKQLGEIRYDTVMGWDRASRSLTELSRLIDGTRLANEVLFADDSAGVPGTLQTDAASVSLYGEYWAQQALTGRDSQTDLVDLAALAQLEIRKNAPRTITFTPAPERAYLPLRDYALGDYVPVWASRSLRETVGIDYASFDADAPGGCGYQRVYGISLDLDDNGVERPQLVTSQDSSNAY